MNFWCADERLYKFIEKCHLSIYLCIISYYYYFKGLVSGLLFQRNRPIYMCIWYIFDIHDYTFDTDFRVKYAID